MERFIDLPPVLKRIVGFLRRLKRAAPDVEGDEIAAKDYKHSQYAEGTPEEIRSPDPQFEVLFQ